MPLKCGLQVFSDLLWSDPIEEETADDLEEDEMQVCDLKSLWFCCCCCCSYFCVVLLLLLLLCVVSDEH